MHQGLDLLPMDDLFIMLPGFRFIDISISLHTRFGRRGAFLTTSRFATTLEEVPLWATVPPSSVKCARWRPQRGELEQLV